MTLSLAILPQKNDKLHETVREASEAFNGLARLTGNLREVEQWIDDVLPRVMKHPEKALMLLLKNPELSDG